ncbi:MAG: TatD family hydrolase [Anaerolineales bacterium]
MPDVQRTTSPPGIAMIDSHIHLQDGRYGSDLDNVVKRAAEAGVTACIVPGTDLATSRAAVALAERYAHPPCAVYATVGYHPTSAHELTEKTLEELHGLAQHPRVVGIGEIGLDYYWPDNPRRDWPCASPEEQRRALEIQLELASTLGLPVVIHDREAHEDTLALLEAWTEGGTDRRGTLHAYAGGPERLEQVLGLGFYVGMDGPVTFSHASGLHAVARSVPLEHLLLETDGPYLTPVPHRGKRNEPAYLTFIAGAIARQRKITPEMVREQTTANACRLFNLAPAP